jgi:hypothetical protein
VADDVHPTGSVRAPTVLRLLAVVFLGVAVIDAIMAVREAVVWPMAVAIGCTGVALCLERLVLHSRAADRSPDDPDHLHRGPADTSLIPSTVVPSFESR